jgi:hypothetical protein
MPEHDLEPPKFARRALDRLLGDWNALKTMVLVGVKQIDEYVIIVKYNNCKYLTLFKAQFNGRGSILFEFTKWCIISRSICLFVARSMCRYGMIFKLRDDYYKKLVHYMTNFVIRDIINECFCVQNLDILLSTMIKESNRVIARDEHADFVVSRFIRSVIRIFSVVSLSCNSNSKEGRRKTYDFYCCK